MPVQRRRDFNPYTSMDARSLPYDSRQVFGGVASQGQEIRDYRYPVRAPGGKAIDGGRQIGGSAIQERDGDGAKIPRPLQLFGDGAHRFVGALDARSVGEQYVRDIQTKLPLHPSLSCKCLRCGAWASPGPTLPPGVLIFVGEVLSDLMTRAATRPTGAALTG